MQELTLKEVATKGGKATFAKYGSGYFKELQSKRRNKRGKYSHKLVLDNE